MEIEPRNLLGVGEVYAGINFVSEKVSSAHCL